MTRSSITAARRTWTDPNAMQVDAVHVNVNQDRQVDDSGSRPDTGKSGKGGKGKSKRGGKGKERGEKAASKFEGECRYCQKRGHKKVDCRKMKSDIAAGNCDKSGKRFWIRLDVLPNQSCQRHPITAARHWRWRGMYWSETNWIST